jgi:hypothetical protein
MEVAIHYGFHGSTIALPEKAQLLFRQRLVRKLRWLVPAFFIPEGLSGIAVVVVDGVAPGLGFRLAALAAIVTWIIVRVVGTVPINSATLDWNAEAPPTDWSEKISKAERFHSVGAWAAIPAFACFLIAMGLRLGVGPAARVGAI